MTIQDGWNFESVGLDAQPPGGKGEGESGQGEGYRGRALLHPSKPAWFPHSFLADCCLFRTLEDIDQVKRFVFWTETLLGGSHLTRQLFPNSSAEADVIFDQLFGNTIGVMKSDQLLFFLDTHVGTLQETASACVWTCVELLYKLLSNSSLRVFWLL